MPPVDRSSGALQYNARIANALLEVLGTSGDAGGRARVLQALGAEGSHLRSGIDWLPRPSLEAMLRAVQIDRLFARRMGQALVRPEGVGLALCYSGLATPEKAYRRAQHLLARESANARYESREIGAERGVVRFHPANPGASERPSSEVGEILCGVREGMLESIPMLYGLLPARVVERRCAYRGDSHCEFEMRWTRSPRSGLLAGLVAGALCSAGAVFAATLHGLPPLFTVPPALALVLLCAMAGRSVDLARQLEAVAGARRGQLALLDQLDGSLAERLDALAKTGGAEAQQEVGARSNEEGLVPVARRPGDGSSAAPEAERAGALRDQIGMMRRDLGELHRLFEGAGGSPGRADQLFRALAGRARLIEEESGCWHADVLPADTRTRRSVSPAELAESAVSTLRAELGGLARIEVQWPDGLPSLDCAAAQVEFLIAELIRVASEGITEAGGVVCLALETSPSGLRCVVSCEGEVLDEDAVDEAFDPFDAGGGSEAALGLPACYRIAEAHGGELHVQSLPGHGVRFAAILPTPLGSAEESAEESAD